MFHCPPCVRERVSASSADIHPAQVRNTEWSRRFVRRWWGGSGQARELPAIARAAGLPDVPTITENMALDAMWTANAMGLQARGALFPAAELAPSPPFWRAATHGKNPKPTLGVSLAGETPAVRRAVIRSALRAACNATAGAAAAAAAPPQLGPEWRREAAREAYAAVAADVKRSDKQRSAAHYELGMMAEAAGDVRAAAPSSHPPSLRPRVMPLQRSTLSKARSR